MKADLQISVKDYSRGKNSKSSSREFRLRRRVSSWCGLSGVAALDPIVGKM
jgi:hypothetical protein